MASKKKKPLYKQVRTTWEGLGFQGSPITKVVQNRKGKGSYKRRSKHGQMGDSNNI